MSDLDLLFRGANAGSESKENDEDLIADVSRLVSIVEMLLSKYSGFILEVYVSPMNILQTKLEEIKHLQFHILYNWSLSLDNVHTLKQECEELFQSLLAGEFDSVENFDEIEFSNRVIWSVPTIQLYSAFKDFDLDRDINVDEVYLWLYDLVKDGDYAISLPISFNQMTLKSILVHCKSPDGIIKLCKIKPEDGPKGMYKISEFKLDTKFYNGVVYVPMNGLKPVQFDLPYQYIDRSSFNMERINRILGIDEDEPTS